MANFFDAMLAEGAKRDVRAARLNRANKKNPFAYMSEAFAFPWEKGRYDAPEGWTAPEDSDYFKLQQKLNTTAPIQFIDGQDPRPMPTPEVMTASQPKAPAPTASPMMSPTPIPTQVPTPTPQASPGYQGGNFFNDFFTRNQVSPQIIQGVPSDLASGISNAQQNYPNIPRDYFAALAFHESDGFNNIPQYGGGGGRGYFQIDSNYHPNVSDAEAYDPTFSANYAGGLIQEAINAGASTPEEVYLYYNGGPRALNNYKPKNKADAKRAKGVKENAKKHQDKFLRSVRNNDFFKD